MTSPGRRRRDAAREHARIRRIVSMSWVYAPGRFPRRIAGEPLPPATGHARPAPVEELALAIAEAVRPHVTAAAAQAAPLPPMETAGALPDRLDHLRPSGRPPGVPRAAAPVSKYLRTLALVLAWALLTTSSARAQIQWLNFDDGEILNVCSAEGPPVGEPFLQFRQSTEISTLRGDLTQTRLRFLYGITSNITCGVSTVHLHQVYGRYEKKGLGDTNLSLKLHLHPSSALPIRLGIRQTLSIPTGYEREADGLARFTSRENDYSAQGLVQYSNPKFSAYLNPGVLLPGGDAPSYLTGGLGLAFTLPYNLDLRGEYYTRWDMADHKYESQIFACARRMIHWNLSVQLGMKRLLLQQEQVDPEFQVAFSFGRDRTPEGQVYEARRVTRPPVALLIHPIVVLPPDPEGVATELTHALRLDDRAAHRALAMHVAGMPGAVSPEILAQRHYELNIKLINYNDRSVGGIEGEPVARVERARAEITVEVELVAPDGYTVLWREVCRGEASQFPRITLAPDSGALASAIVPDDVRVHLRRAAARDLARKVVADVGGLIERRENEAYE